MPASAAQPAPVRVQASYHPRRSPRGTTGSGRPCSAGSCPGDESLADLREAARLEVLRALERGELDVEAASHRLEILDAAGPSSFRGWC